MEQLLSRPEFPRCDGYDPDWVIRGSLGPHPLWLAEWLLQGLDPTPEMRVLDLGCGKAITSVFWARELDAQVYAADLWTSVDDNWQRIRDAGEAGRVTPLHAEAHALPFAAGFFDAILSVDAYQYFGTDLLYLHYLSRFLRPGGVLGVVMPGLMQPLSDGRPPAHLTEPQANGKVFWEDECVSLRTLDWWRDLFRQCARVELFRADSLSDGWRLWRDFELAVARSGHAIFSSDAQALERDGGRYLGFLRLLARRRETTGVNLYDPALLAKVEGAVR